jgi:hypothetical protein
LQISDQMIVGVRAVASGVDEDRAARRGQVDQGRSALIDIDITHGDFAAQLRFRRRDAGGRVV